jgi:uncharacterized protein YbjT (DUF2867 family)
MPGTILVTGATGNVGGKVVQKLAAAGLKVRAAGQSAAKADSMKVAGVQPVECDFNRPETMRAALEGVERLFLLTPFVPNMVELAARMMEEARRAKVQYIVRMSAMGADLEPGIQLGRWHRQVEEMVESSRIPFTILRPNVFMQNYSSLYAQTIKNESAFYLPAGEAKVSYIDTRDIAAAAVETLTTVGYEGIFYDLTGPEALSNIQIAEILSQVAGRKVRYVSISDEQARQRMHQAGTPDWAIDAMMELYALNRSGRSALVTPAVEQVTGKKPLSFAQFARDHASAFRPSVSATR